MERRQVASGALYQLRCVQSGASCARVNVAVALQGEKALGEPNGWNLEHWGGAGHRWGWKPEKSGGERSPKKLVLSN